MCLSPDSVRKKVWMGMVDIEGGGGQIHNVGHAFTFLTDKKTNSPSLQDSYSYRQYTATWQTIV